MEADTGVAVRMKDGTFHEALYHPEHELGEERSEVGSKYAVRRYTQVARGFSIENVELVDVKDIWVLEGALAESSVVSESSSGDVDAGEVAKSISSGAQAVCGAGKQDMQRVVHELSNSNELVYLNLSGVENFGAAGIDWRCAFFKALISNSQLLHLNLSSTRIDIQACLALSEMLLQNSTLASLDISSNPLGDAGCTRGRLAETLTKNSSLQVLRMRCCEVGDGGAKALARALRQNITLQQLCLRSNRIGDAGGYQLANSIRASRLTSLDLHGNPVSRPQWFVGQEVRVCHDASTDEWNHAIVTCVHGEKVLAAISNSEWSRGWPHTWEHMEPEEGFMSVMQTIRKFTSFNKDKSLNRTSSALQCEGLPDKELEEDPHADCSRSDCASTSNSGSWSPESATSLDFESQASVAACPSDPDRVSLLPSASSPELRVSRRPSKLMEADTGVAVRMKDGTFHEALYHPEHELGEERSEVGSKYAVRRYTQVARGFSIENVELVDVKDIWVLEGALAESSVVSESSSGDVDAGEVAKSISSGAQAVCGAGKQDMQRVVHELSNSNELVYLNLSGVENFGAAGIDWRCAFFKALISNSQLLHLNLSSTRIDIQACLALSEMLLQNSTLASLDISSNPLGDAGCTRGRLAETLTKNSSLQVLRMRCCEVGDGGAKALARALRQNITLQQLCLRSNRIGDAGGYQLANSIRASRLTSLDLHGNPVSRPQWFVGQEVRVCHDASTDEWNHAIVTCVHGEKVLAAVSNLDGSRGWPHTWERMEPESGFLNVTQTVAAFLQENRAAKESINDH